MKTDSLDALFIETPVRSGKISGEHSKTVIKAVGAKPLKTAKTKHNPFQGVSSWAILRELLSRHYVDLQVFGFWTILAVIVWLKLG